MKRIGKFVRLPIADKGLIISALLTLGAVRVGLWVLPFRALQVVLSRLENAKKNTEKVRISGERVVWAIKVSSFVIPAATCLVQALSAKLLLTRRGYRPVLRIGVAKNKNGQLEAHAWVENEGQVVLGEVRDRSRYTSLPPILSPHA